jgi:hypothetical protein
MYFTRYIRKFLEATRGHFKIVILAPNFVHISYVMKKKKESNLHILSSVDL